MVDGRKVKELIRRFVRRFARMGYRLVRPVVRPLMHRTRGFFLQAFSAELQQSQTATINEIRAFSAELQRSQTTTTNEIRAFAAELQQSRTVVINEIRAAQVVLLDQIRELQQEGIRHSRMTGAQLLQSIQASRESLREEMLRLNDDASEVSSYARAESLVAATTTQATLARVEILADASARRIALHAHGNSILMRSAVGYVLCADTDLAVLAGLLDTGELERGTRLLIERLLRPGDVFVDAGAHLGLLTLAAARAMGGRGRIFAFEPFPDTCEKLVRSVWLNGYSSIVKVHEMAVSDHEGRTTLFLGQVSGHHSIFPLGSATNSAEPSAEVSVTTLDAALPAVQDVTLLKIDVEGAEINVLNGARTLLANNRDMAIIVECGPQHLARTGYTVERWLEVFRTHGLIYRAINAESGMLEDVSATQLAASESVNLLFGHPESSVWTKLDEREAAK